MAALETVRKMRESVSMMKEKVIKQDVEFTYYAPGAKAVCLAGKFNDWNTKSLPMRKGKDGNWSATIKLSPGRHEYKYFVDGSWAQDMRCADRVLNSFGSYNCVIGVK